MAIFRFFPFILMAFFHHTCTLLTLCMESTRNLVVSDKCVVFCIPNFDVFVGFAFVAFLERKKNP